MGNNPLRNNPLRGRRGKATAYLFNDELEHDLRLRFQIVYLDKLRLIQPVGRCQCAEQRVLAFVQRHRSIGMGLCHVLDCVVVGLQVC